MPIYLPGPIWTTSFSHKLHSLVLDRAFQSQWCSVYGVINRQISFTAQEALSEGAEWGSNVEAQRLNTSLKSTGLEPYFDHLSFLLEEENLLQLPYSTQVEM